MTLQTRLDGNVIQSGSIPVTAITNFTEALTVALPAGTISGSAQIVNALPTNTVSSSAQVTAFLPANTVSSSGQIQLDAITGTTFTTTDFTFPQAVTASNVLITGIATVRELQTLLVTSSIIFESGSTKFGDTADDTHQFTGSLSVLGNVSSSIGFSGSGINITNIPNSGLVNSSVTVNGTAISLGGSGTVTAAAGTLTGTTLASGVTASSLTSVGTLSSLSVTGDLTVDTSTLKVDSANNRVGIGTSTPGALLDVTAAGIVNARINNTASSADAYLIFKNTAGESFFGVNATGPYIYTATAQAMTFATNNIDRMTIDASGNVGIGTTSPGSYRLVADSGAGVLTGRFVGAGGETILSLANTGTNGRNWFLIAGGNGGSFSSGQFGIYDATASAERLSITSGGNVGIGTASPNRKLVINTTGDTYASIVGGTSSVASLLFGDTTTDSVGRITYDNSNDSMTLLTNSENRLSITSAGNVGIGTTSPGLPLFVRNTGPDVFGTVKGVAGFTDSSSAFKGVSLGYDTSAQTGVIWAETGAAASNLAFWTYTGAAWGERVRITAAGEFAVNNTTPAAFNTQLLSVSTSASKYAGVFYGNASANDGQAALQVAKSSATNTSSQVLVEFYINAFNTASGRIVANGASAAAFAAFSDERLKENIAELPSQLDNILALRPVEFDFKDGSGHQIGFIAQEFREVYPDAVTGDGDEMLTLVGWNKTDARLVKALQEAMARIESLETSNAELMARIDTLES